MARKPRTPSQAAAPGPQPKVASTPAEEAQKSYQARTAVLIVHGMGDQRPLVTLRAIADAVWKSDPAVSGSTPRYWVHPDNTTSDVELPVVTTDTVVGQRRAIEFHEFYWAHVMSEPRFIAVLLWLFDLVRKGPRLLRWDMKLCWLVAAPFLVACLHAAIILTFRAAFWMAGVHDLPLWVDNILPWAVTCVVALLTMGRRGVVLLVGLALAAKLISIAFGHRHLFGGLDHRPTLVTALVLLAVFLVANAFFLQTVLGDAARYFRNAPANISVMRQARQIGVDMLERLHTNGKFDRIIVVAHSLGSVIAYDVLRAYWSRVCAQYRDLGTVPGLDQQDRFGTGARTVESAPGGPKVICLANADRRTWRRRGRRLLSALNAPFGPGKAPWLVTDFVTVGSPLTHAKYFQAEGEDAKGREAYYQRRRRERDLPQDPAWLENGDGTMTYVSPVSGRRRFHHAAMFGVTRWTNLFFPSRLLTGDFIAGPLHDTFGQGIEDVAVNLDGGRPWFGHTRYWEMKEGHPNSHHLVELRRAIDLRDSDFNGESGGLIDPG